MPDQNQPPLWRQIFLSVQICAQKNPRTAGFLALGGFWIFFAWTWGPLSPFNLWAGNNLLFSPKWWFDALGHSAAGVMLAITFLHVYRTSQRSLELERDEQKFESLIWKIKLKTFYVAVVWEILEMCFDWYKNGYTFTELITNIQKGGADTTIDIALTAFCGAFLMECYERYKIKSRKKHPDKYVQIDRKIELILALHGEVMEDLRLIRTEDRKERIARLKEAAKRLTKFLRKKAI